MKQDVFFFRSGDIVEVKVWVVEGFKKCLQVFEGVVIVICNCGLYFVFIVCKIFNGEGVECVFQIYFSVVDSIFVKCCGVVCKVKLYYLCECIGKVVCIKECFN